MKRIENDLNKRDETKSILIQTKRYLGLTQKILLFHDRSTQHSTEKLLRELESTRNSTLHTYIFIRALSIIG